MKYIRHAFVFLALLVLNLHAENDGYMKWQAQKSAVMQDKGLARYYTFEDVKDSKSVIKDIKGSDADLVFMPYRDGDKPVYDLKVIDGRVEGKKAVRLDRGWYQGEALDIKGKQFTASVWFRRQGAGSLLSASMAEEGSIVSVDGWERGWSIATVYDNYNTLRFCLGQPGGCGKVMSDIPVPDNVWHHLAVVWDGRIMLVYLNGTLVGKKEYVGNYIPSGGGDYLRIGYAGGNTGSVILDIDELAIYNRALSRKEVTELGSSGINPAVEIFNVADRHIEAKDYASARTEYGKLKDMQSVLYGRELALFNIAETYRLEKNYGKVHRTYSEIFSLPGLTANYHIYGLFRQAEVYTEQLDYKSARRLYSEIKEREGVQEYHAFKAELYAGDTCRKAGEYNRARDIYLKLLKAQDSSYYPHENHRLELVDRLEALEGLKDGQAEKSVREKRIEWINSPEYSIYVALNGSDSNPGTKDKPFATIKKARDEVRRIKGEKGLPEGGIVVYLRGGKYFLTEGLVFEEEDSGTENAPVVYRNYPGEKARIIGGKQLTNFKPLDDPAIIKRLPGEAKGKVWVSDLKEEGITVYGNLVNRGQSYDFINKSAMELFCNGMPMTLARWPDYEWAIVSDLVTPGGDGGSGDYVFQKGRFRYSGRRPERWAEEDNIWTVGYFYWPWDKIHTQVVEIDTENRIVNLAPDIRHAKSYPAYDMPVRKNVPYFFYNMLSEISIPGEFFVDRDAGKLYFYPPDGIEDREIIASTLDAPIMEMKSVSNFAVFGLTLECTWHNAVTLDDCTNTLVAGSTLRNTGNLAAIINDGWRNGIVGCDIYDTGEGAIRVTGGNWLNLLPSGHCIENNHIYRYNRFSHGGGKFAVVASGVGVRIGYNLVSDAPYAGIMFDGNNHVIEYNEIYDIMHQGKDGGAIYTYGAPRSLLNRGNVMRYNFVHNITEHSSVVPYDNPGVTCIYIDALNAGMTMTGNVFYRSTGSAMFTHGAYSRVEDNIFVDNRLGIHQGNRSYLLRDPYRVKQWSDNFLDKIGYRQPPWSARYPQMKDILHQEKNKHIGWPKEVFIERNINTGGQFMRITDDLFEGNTIRDNLDGCDPLFVDAGNRDFRIRPGSPAYGIAGCEPVPFEKIGLYEDALRASWPPDRIPAGKYYKPEKLESLPPERGSKQPAPDFVPDLRFMVKRKTSEIKIDGRLEKEEWSGLEKNRAMIIEKNVGGDKPGDRSYAWMLYDDKYLYVAVENGPNPFREGMHESQRKPSMILNEMAIEGIYSPATWWWHKNIDTGPVYIFWGYPDGRLEVKNNFGMPRKTVEYIQRFIEYRAVMLNEEDYHWTAEWKIPFSALNIYHITDTIRFNLGAPKRGGWIAWAPTGWLLDRAGILKFIK